MSEDTDAQLTREAVGVFHSAQALQDAIDELLRSGFDRANLNLLAGDEAVQAKLGHIYRKIEEAEDDPEAPRRAYVAPEAYGDLEGGIVGTLIYLPAIVATGAVVASGGGIPAAIAAAALGAGGGGVVGGALAKLIGRQHADEVQAALEAGGLLLWVTTGTPEAEAKAVAILKRHSGDDVHVHGHRVG
ncbi:MAG: hypothetical protein RID91_00350 [Azospirillaceae bacterium]